MAQARGKYAKAISDRSGMEFPYNEMVREWNGHLVHKSEFEAKHPQLELRSRSGDAQGLFDARPDRTEEEVARILGPDPFETISASSGIINVFEKSHGRSTSDTVRFRDASNVANLPAATINASGGYTITKVNDNNYTFSSGVTASVTLKGGGDIASAGPVTVTA